MRRMGSPEAVFIQLNQPVTALARWLPVRLSGEARYLPVSIQQPTVIKCMSLRGRCRSKSAGYRKIAGFCRSEMVLKGIERKCSLV